MPHLEGDRVEMRHGHEDEQLLQHVERGRQRHWGRIQQKTHDLRRSLSQRRRDTASLPYLREEVRSALAHELPCILQDTTKAVYAKLRETFKPSRFASFSEAK